MSMPSTLTSWFTNKRKKIVTKEPEDTYIPEDDVRLYRLLSSSWSIM